ncbi:hypothetical protein BGZ60DRAFT_376194, partial [Tricladium varicosporioides]
IRYLYSIYFLDIIYNKNRVKVLLVIVLDILFANNLETRQLSYRYIILLFEGLITWRTTC